ncbi:MAG: hypothetical protein PVF74_00840 [Anaerolineales bacterium]
MSRRIPKTFSELGGLSLLMGVAMAACLVALLKLPLWRGPYVTSFLSYYLIAGGAYLIVTYRLRTDRLPIYLIWVFAVLFRVILLYTTPSLSDDVFRFIWDGHLINAGMNPYTYPVNDPHLDPLNTELRSLVNHSWMASPYLPSAQLLFSIVGKIDPQQAKAYQITAVLLDLSTGWLVMSNLRRLTLPPSLVLIYLWNPLVIVEFAQGAHVVDALMICLVMLSFWLLLLANPIRKRASAHKYGSVVSMAAATLTKGLPVLFLPVLWRRWGWIRLFLYFTILLTISTYFANNAGWGLFGPIDGRGYFGALRIYLSQWNFNGGLYHWLEVWISGYPTPGAVPVEIVGEAPIRLARLISAALIGLSMIGTAIWSYRLDDPSKAELLSRTLALLRLATLPIGAYLLFTHTVHPWYVILMIPFLPFLLPQKEKTARTSRLIWPWMYLSLSISFSYLTYINPNDFRELSFVRLVEYLPFYGLLLWALVPLIQEPLTSIVDGRIRWGRIKRR